MSTELGLVLLVALLWGPTALWLGYRAVRGHQGRLSGSSDVTFQPMRSAQPSSDEIEALVARDGFWVCWTCRSLNRREAQVCYACHAAMASAGGPAPAEMPAGRLVPVMAEGLARSVGAGASSTVSPVATGDARPAQEVPARDRKPVLGAAPHGNPWGAFACPYVGFRDDPSTRCDFPDPRNVCHATSPVGAASFASPRRFVPGKGGTARALPIGAEHQRASCLSATYQQCARYPAAQAVPANL